MQTPTGKRLENPFERELRGLLAQPDMEIAWADLPESFGDTELLRSTLAKDPIAGDPGPQLEGPESGQQEPKVEVRPRRSGASRPRAVSFLAPRWTKRAHDLRKAATTTV